MGASAAETLQIRVNGRACGSGGFANQAVTEADPTKESTLLVLIKAGCTSC